LTGSEGGGPEGPGGPIVTVLGHYTDGILPVLTTSAPSEVFSATPTPAAEIVVTLMPDPTDLEAALTPGVRWVHVLGTGVDGFPLQLVGNRTLTCSRGAAATAIAEWVLATMLAFAKRLPESWITSPPAQWNRAQLGSLQGSTLGLIGLGSIGVEIARRALAFDMRTVAARRKPAPSPVAGVEVTTDLDLVLAAADHLVVAAPSTPRTRHLIGPDALATMKAGVHLINIARGNLIDQDALRQALDSGRVAMASLDVVDPEPLPPGHWLYSHPHVRLSPHISWSAPGSQGRTLQLFVDELRRYRSGQPPRGLVDVAEGY
jgi:phosphoglycerate dehydrogenase-like enzyme